MQLGGKIKPAIFLAVFLFLICGATAWASDYQANGIASDVAKRQSDLHIYDYAADTNSYSEQKSFLAFDASFYGGGSVALADLGGDGVKEIIVGAGPGSAPQVRIFRANGSFINGFYAYSQSFDKGIQVAAGDLDGDGKDEIVTGPQAGGSPHVRIFDGYGQPKFNLGFFAYDYTYRGGINLAVGDVNGDKQAEIIVGPGADSGPQVRIFNKDGKAISADFWPFAESDRGGVAVGVGNFDGGADQELIMAIQTAGESWVKVYKNNVQQTILGEFRAYDSTYRGGINISGGDVDLDGQAEVVTAVHGSGGPQLKFFNLDGSEAITNFFAYEETYRGGLNAVVGNLDKDAALELVTIPTQLPPSGRTDLEKYVYVDLSEQRLYAYEWGYLANSFLVSTGLPRTPTPVGDFSIFKKIYSHLYSGPGYYLPNTLYNMGFKPGYYLHGAYWHHNWGHPMSHGCVNISYPDAEWLYNWSVIGTPVFIRS